ncbi:hypothetical protein ACFQY7_14370 [Actinomadura luteofluorescens]|uniref:hypothetical protein n=1 Tax=Actinomadura luteofluorescens TaxID=46163 RepID=UPI003643894B
MRASLARSASRHTLVWVLGSFIVVPLLYAVVSGFKTTGDLTTDPVGLPRPGRCRTTRASCRPATSGGRSATA